MQIHKPDTLIEYPHDMSLVEQRVFNLAILSYQQSTPDQDEYKLNIGLYSQLYGLDRATAYKGLIEAIQALDNRSFHNTKFNTVDKFFDFITYERNVGGVRFRFSEETLYEFQHAPKTTIDLNLTQKLQSKYALHLYELFLCKHKNNSTQLSYSIQKFRDFIGLGGDEYKVWSNLKTRVIDESINLINKHTDIHVEYQLFRENRKTSDISFAISLKR